MHSDRLQRRFDTWEALTRGLSRRPYRVEAEPAYRPLLAKERIYRGIIDDARRPGLLERLFGQAREKPQPRGKAVTGPTPCMAPDSPAELEILAREDWKPPKDMGSRTLAALAGVRCHASFEIIATASRITTQFVCDGSDVPKLRSAIRAYAPNVRLRARTEVLESLLLQNEGVGVVVPLALSDRVFKMLRTGSSWPGDSLAEVVGNLDDLDASELAIVQVLFAPTRFAWGNDLEEFASSIEDVDRVLPLIREKFSGPTFAAVVRVAAFGSDEQQVLRRANRLAGAVVSITRSDTNVLTVARAQRHSFEDECLDLIERQTRRRGMLLSIDELETLVHVPSAGIQTQKLQRLVGGTKRAPSSLGRTGIVIGVNEHDDEEVPVALSWEERLRHTHIIGASGSGKSTLLLSMIHQDLEAGNGFAVLDPHGDLIDDVLGRVPASRAADVALIDASDEAYPFAFNPLRAESEIERTLLASDFVSVFRRLSSTTFGDQMVSVLGNAVQAFVESEEGGTLLDLRNFLLDGSYRARLLTTVRDPEIVRYWRDEFPLLKGGSHVSILTRLNTFLRPKVLRYMVGQRDDRLDLRAMIDGRKIILAKLARGLVGGENSYLLGSLLVSRIAQAVISRQDEAATERTPFVLYIDEFHHFVTPSIATILTGARKFGLGLCLAHHEMRQIRSQSEDVAGAVLANAYTRIVFQVGDADARLLADGFSDFTASDLQRLPIGHAIARVGRADCDFNLRTIQAPKVADDEARTRSAAVRESSRSTYATPRAEVERLFEEVEATAATPASNPKPDRPKQDAETRTTEADALAGRGGPEHRYVQDLIRKLGEQRGFSVSVEKRVLGGHGHVDVVLERDDLTIGCEISMSTRASHEVGNLAKLIAAGFDYAVFITSKERVRKAAKDAMGDAESARMRFVTPEGFVAFLGELASPKRRRRSAPAKSEKPSTAEPEEKPRGLISAKRAAELLGIKYQTLSKMRLQGKSPPYREIGSRVLYDFDQLQAWIAARERRSTSDPGKSEDPS